MTDSDRPLRKKLLDFSEVVQDLGQDAVLEMAALGSLIDWELAKLLGRSGYHLVRQSFSLKDDETLLVLKVRIDDALWVAFVTRNTPIDCMATLCRKLSEGSIKFYPDKYS